MKVRLAMLRSFLCARSRLRSTNEGAREDVVRTLVCTLTFTQHP